jgi:hypothetical protein
MDAVFEMKYGRDHVSIRSEVIDTPLPDRFSAPPDDHRHPGIGLRRVTPRPLGHRSWLRVLAVYFGLSRPATIQTSMSGHPRAERPINEEIDPEGMHPDRLGMIGPNRGEPRPCRLESTRLFRQELSERRW